MGLMQRQKGYREERNLVWYFLKRKYEAFRIPNSYATDGLRSQGLAGDVVIKHPDRKDQETLELKSSKTRFRNIYDLYCRREKVGGHEEGAYRFAYPTTDGRYILISIGTDFEQVRDLTFEMVFKKIDPMSFTPKQRKAFLKLIRLEEEKKDADFLVIKQNITHHLFIKYWGVGKHA